MIEMKNVTKIFGKDFKAVDNVSLTIKEGLVYGLLGPNGAGKTTILRMITGVLAPNEGQILINGIDIAKNPTLAKKEFGFVSDNPDVFLKLKGIEYLKFMGTIYEVEEKKLQENIKHYAKVFEMEDALNNLIESYSHGMRQKIVLIGTLIHEPKIWILDEPMTGIDPKSSFMLKNMIAEHVKKGNSVVFSTHVLEVAEKVCDVVGVINKGKLIFNGPIDKMKEFLGKDESLEKMFLELTEDDK